MGIKWVIKFILGNLQSLLDSGCLFEESTTFVRSG